MNDENCKIFNGTVVTPLTHAARCGNVRILRVLVKFGDDLFARDEHGRQAIHQAALCHQISAINAIIDAIRSKFGAEVLKEAVNSQDFAGMTPIDLVKMGCDCSAFCDSYHIM